MCVKSQQPLCEEGDDLSNRIRQIRERFNNRLIFPLSKLREHYIQGNLHIRLHLRCAKDGNEYSPSVCVLYRQIFSRDSARPLASWRPKDDNEFPMLIDNIHVVDDPQGIVFRGFRPSGLQILKGTWLAIRASKCWMF